MNKRIPYTKPSITAKEVAMVSAAAESGWGDRCYEHLNQFEREFAAHIGVRFAIATSSCTGAIHLGLAAIGIGLGDEVIVPECTWIATAAPIVHLGAKPIFVDILADSWCIDPKSAERAITPRTKAIMAVHLYGNACDMAALQDIGRRHGVPVIEDAAEGLGTIIHGKRAGSMGAFASFSFHGTKTLTTGEGGMFVTDDPSLYETALTLSNHGRARGQRKQFWPDMLGYKFKMSNIQAALGCAQLGRIEELVARKREILAYYRDRLCKIRGVTMNPEPQGVVNGAWMPTVVFAPELGVTREALIEAFAKEDIDARVFFHPLSSLPMFEPVRSNACAWDVPRRSINLPSFHDMTDQDLDRVIEVVAQCIHDV
jgi:perosamine synthetase